MKDVRVEWLGKGYLYYQLDSWYRRGHAACIAAAWCPGGGSDGVEGRGEGEGVQSGASTPGPEYGRA